MAGLEPFTTLLSRVRRTLVAAKEQRNTMGKVIEDLQAEDLTCQSPGFLAVKDISFWVRDAGGRDACVCCWRSPLYTS